MPGESPGMTVQMDSIKSDKMIRCKTYTTGKYIEKELFNLSPNKKPFERAKKIKESTPAQKNLNDKKARRQFRRILHCNFTKKDLAVHLTFDEEHLPETEKDAIRLIGNYIRVIRRMWEKQFPGKPFKYVYVFSDVAGDGSGEVVRKHFHLIMSGGLTRDDIEDKWKYGFANADRLRFTETGIEKLANYMLDQACGKRRWKGSNNLIKPEPVVSDKAISRADIEKIRRNPEDREFIEKLINKDRKDKWILTKCEVTYDGREIFGSDIDPGEGMGIAILVRARKEDWMN